MAYEKLRPEPPPKKTGFFRVELALKDFFSDLWYKKQQQYRLKLPLYSE